MVPGKERNPVFNFSKHHTQSVVTENFLKYIKDECLTFRVLGFPDVKKQVENSSNIKRSKAKRDAAQAIMGD